MNTDSMIDAIEENIHTLSTIGSSPFASHIKGNIAVLEETLRKMLIHIKEWVQAQKYWLTLDPVYNNGLFHGFFGTETQKFRNVRDKFRRIVWSAFRNPKAIYNLLIEDRIATFQELVSFYDRLQKTIHGFMEKKRLEFPRFFFLNDS